MITNSHSKTQKLNMKPEASSWALLEQVDDVYNIKGSFLLHRDNNKSIHSRLCSLAETESGRETLFFTYPNPKCTMDFPSLEMLNIKKEQLCN